MRIKFEAFMDVDPFRFELATGDVDYIVLADLLKDYPELVDIETYEIERDSADSDYDESKADEARREQDHLVSEYFRGLL